jgi:hypothetical protein
MLWTCSCVSMRPPARQQHPHMLFTKCPRFAYQESRMCKAGALRCPLVCANGVRRCNPALFVGAHREECQDTDGQGGGRPAVLAPLGDHRDPHPEQVRSDRRAGGLQEWLARSLHGAAGLGSSSSACRERHMPWLGHSTISYVCMVWQSFSGMNENEREGQVLTVGSRAARARRQSC